MDLITNYKILKQKSKEVSLKESKKIIKQLEETLKNYSNGIGLSAIQIGISKRVGIIRLKDFKLDLINPEIIVKEYKFRMKGESCLSLRNLSVDTIRYNSIKIINNGKEESYCGLVAVAIQHEIDHMKGILITDRVWRKR